MRKSIWNKTIIRPFGGHKDQGPALHRRGLFLFRGYRTSDLTFHHVILERFVPDLDPVRRQMIRLRLRVRLAECLARRGVDVKRRSCGAASADVRWSVA